MRLPAVAPSAAKMSGARCQSSRRSETRACDGAAPPDRLPEGAGVRTWAYIAHRSDWLAEPAAMAERAMAVEEKLSDALHERLTQRFVDRRTSVLMRDLGKKGAGEFPVIVDEQGEVTVGSFPIGRMEGFSF